MTSNEDADALIIIMHWYSLAEYLAECSVVSVLISCDLQNVRILDCG